jgi:cell division protein FtsI/penicillin-binding protein 2
MPNAFQERRIRRSDILFGVILLSAFAVLLGFEILIQLNMRDEVIKHLARSENIMRLNVMAPRDAGLVPLLDRQGKQQEALLSLSEQKARIAVSMKKRLDAHADRILKTEREVAKLLKDEQKARVSEEKATKPKQQKLGPRR